MKTLKSEKLEFFNWQYLIFDKMLYILYNMQIYLFVFLEEALNFFEFKFVYNWWNNIKPIYI